MISLPRRHTFVALGLALAASAVCAQSYPDRPVKLVVPYAPGGSADIAARLFADEWGKALGQPVVVDNKAGAGGNIGVDAVAKAKAKADGYTLGLQTVSLAINPALYPKLPFNTLKDLAPVGMVATSQHVLVVNNGLGVKTLKDFLVLARAQPGQLSYGSAGNGSTFHMSAELFKAVANVDIAHVPYRGGGPALVDTIGGQVGLSFPVLSAVRQHVQSGKLTALGVTGGKRSPLLPEVPTLAEAGLPGYTFETWFMVFAPAGVPQPVLDRLNATLNQTLKSPAVQERMVKEGFDPLTSTPAQARERLAQEIPMWTRLVKARGITVD